MTKDSFDNIAEQLLGDRDIDNDGVINYEDCRPLDPEHQDIKGTLSSIGSAVKSGAEKLKEKYEDLQLYRKKKAEQKKREAELKRQKKLADIQKKKQEIERKKELKKAEKELKELEGPGIIEKLIGAASGTSRSSKEGRSVDPDDKWAVVSYPNASIIASFRYKSDAKDYSKSRAKTGVIKTSTALRRGYTPGSQAQAIDIFGGDSGPGDLENMVVGSSGDFDITGSGKSKKKSKKQPPWYEQGLV